MRDKLKAVSNAFCLTRSKAAAILRCSRAEIVALTENGTAEEAVLRRLNIVHDLVVWSLANGMRHASELAHVPFVKDHRSVVDILSTEVLDDGAVSEAKRRLLLIEEDERGALVGRRWASDDLPSQEAQESNLENNMRALLDT